jgi:LPXTG-motif cell wall-anchored protein
MKTHSTMTIHVKGDMPQVAKGVIQSPNHPNLPATGNQRSLPLSVAGLVMVALILFKISKRHAWWLVFLAFALTHAQPVQAAELPQITSNQVSLWDVQPAKPTPPAHTWTFGNNGFVTPPTHYADTINTTVNTPLQLNTKYDRPWFTDTFRNLDITLTIWRVSVYAGGRYSAKVVETQKHSQEIPFAVFDFVSKFSWTPTTSGTYFMQYTTNTPISLSDSTPVASGISRIFVKQATTGLKIKAPAVVFPSTGSPADQAAALTTPIDATDPINWTASEHVTLEHTAGETVGFRGQATDTINWDVNRPGLPAGLGATAGFALATHDLHIGGLAAIETSADALDLAPLKHSTQGLSETAAKLPGRRWQFEWLVTPTKLVGKNLHLDLSKQKAMATFSGVNNASGYVDQLTDAAVAFELMPTGSLVDTLMQATSAGTPYVLQLKLQMQANSQIYTLTSNYAGISVAKPQHMLSLIVNQKATWEFTRLQLFDETPVAPQTPITITLRDRHPQPDWTLSVSLAARPSKKEFPFTLLIGADQQVDDDHPAAVIKTGQKDLVASAVDLRLQPTAEATTSLDKQWRADIVWTVAQKINANGL